MRFASCFSVVIFLLFAGIPHCAVAQSGVWDNPKNPTKKAAKKLDNGRNRIKKWKEHIKQWGMMDDYNHQLSVGGKLNSNGWSGCLYYYTKIKPGVDQLWSLTFSEIKHEKQVKQQKENIAFPQLGNPTPFVYGKINNLYTLQLGHGREFLLLPGVVEGNLSLSMRFTGGISLAMLKPYYLRLIYADYTQTPVNAELKEEKYSHDNAEQFLKNGNILGASKWKKGLGETKFVPGLFLEASAVIVPGQNKGFVQSITLGTNIAFYTKQLPILAEVKAYPWQGSLFVGLALGKRWR